MTRQVGDDHPRTLMQRGNLASLEIRHQKFDRARELTERNVSTARADPALPLIWNDPSRSTT